MKQEIYLNDFINAFQKMNRDYYSYDGYKELFDYYDQFEDFYLDVIAICGEVSEYDEETLLKDYEYLLNSEEWREENPLEMFNNEEEQKKEYLKALVEELEQQTSILSLDNGSYLVWSF